MTWDSQNSPWLGLEGSHHLPRYSIFCTSSRGPHSNGFLSRNSQKGVPKLPGFELPQLCEAITSCSNLWSGWGLKQSCNSHWELSNGVSHATCTHENRFNSRLFVSGVSLIPILSFCHNLYCRCPNGSCEPILDIQTSIVFQWYKELLNARCFDLCDRSMKVSKSTGTSTPKMGDHLGVWVFMLTLSHTSLGPRPCKPLPWSWAQG
jgi:hypothetical protein